ncbi:MAG: hypothetical protein V3T23_08440 [Nitrososphaerales archaeon]
MKESESTTGTWLRNLATVVDKKDMQNAELHRQLNHLTQNRQVVGWFHPDSRRFIYDDSKEHAIKSGAKNAPEMKGYSIPVFIQLERE